MTVPFRSGFAAVVGRPNVGKSTLVNRMVGSKVTITSPRPNTTRSQVRGVLNRPGSQVVFVDTPGLHKPRTPLGQRMNESATSSLDDVDVVLALVEASGPIGPGDRMVLAHGVDRVRSLVRTWSRPTRPSAPSGVPGGVGQAGGADDGDAGVPGDDGEAGLPGDGQAGGADDGEAGGADGPGPTLLVVVNKIDRVGDDGVLTHLAEASAVVDELMGRPGSGPVPVEYFPISATEGSGVDALVDAVVERMPEGPRYYPEGMVTDVAEAWWVADLVREQLLHRVEEELPHSIACRVTEWEWPRIRCEILVERDSQKGIVIGRAGSVLKDVGTAVRAQLPAGAYLELFVRVERRWQHREDALDRLGL